MTPEEEESAPQTGGAKRRPGEADLAPLLLLISEGMSLRKACEDLGLDTPSTHRWLDDDEGRRQQYARAREMRGDVYAEMVLNVANSVIKKTVKPDAGRVAIDAFKWAAGRMNRKDWGDKQQHEHTGADGGPIKYANMTREERQARIAELQERARGAQRSGGD